jgi:hypothetical protein
MFVYTILSPCSAVLVVDLVTSYSFFGGKLWQSSIDSIKDFVGRPLSRVGSQSSLPLRAVAGTGLLAPTVVQSIGLSLIVGRSVGD